MRTSGTIHIVFACDDKYAQHAGVAITSLREQQRSGSPVQVHLLDGGISAVNLERLHRLKDGHLDIIIYKGNIEEYSQYLTATYVSKATYLRLSIEKILPAEINRVIYCDSDVVFLKPIDELWNIDLSGHWLAAVPDPPHALNQGHWKDLGIEGGRYFNAGVILIDLNSWRDHHVSEQVKGYLRSHWDKVLSWDQDGLNAVLYKNWLPLDICWNTFSGPVDKKKLSASIIHFASELKPWFYKSLDSFQPEYMKYLHLSPWKDYQFPDKNVCVWIYRKILLHTPQRVLKVVFLITWRLRSFIKEFARWINLITMKLKH